mgnify:CR=1 FL=1
MRDKHAKFRELAEARTSRALDAIRKIGNLSNSSLYEWEEAEVRKIVKALKDSVAEIERSFDTTKSKREIGFKL